MSAAQRYHDAVQKNTQTRGVQVSGDILSLLLTSLVPILIESMSNCFKKATAADVAERLTKSQSDFMVQQQALAFIRKEVRDSRVTVEKSDQIKLRDASLEELGVDPARTREMVDEILAIQQYGMI